MMRTYPRTPYSRREAPAEPAIWLFVSSFWWRLRHRGLWPALKGWLAYLIQGEQLWGRYAGEHMAVVIGDDLYEAAWPAVRRVPAAEALRRDARVYQFRILAVDQPELALLRAWLHAVVGKPYDVWLFSVRAIAAIARIARLVGKPIPDVPIIDLAGDGRYICYELAARALLRLGISCDPATFAPPDLWRLAEAGKLSHPVCIEPEP